MLFGTTRDEDKADILEIRGTTRDEMAITITAYDINVGNYMKISYAVTNTIYYYSLASPDVFNAGMNAIEVDNSRLRSLYTGLSKLGNYAQVLQTSTTDEYSFDLFQNYETQI